MPEYGPGVISPRSMASQEMNAPRGVVRDSQSIGSQDSEEEKDICLLKTLMTQAVSSRSDTVSDWPQRMKWYKGDQWDKKRASYKSSPVLNMIRISIQGQIPILTDQHPGVNIIPAEPMDYDFAQILDDLVSSWWDRNRMDHKLIELLMDCMIYDIGVAKVTWDPNAENGAGDVAITVLDPSEVYFPFTATDFDRPDCAWVIHRTFQAVSDLKIQFSKMADRIKPDQGEKEKDNQEQMNNAGITLVSPTDKKGINSPASPTNLKGDQRQTCEVWECWIDSDEVEQISNEEDGSFVIKKKYPKGLVITILPNQNLRLQRVESPYEHRKKPFIRFVDTILSRSLYGEGETKILMEQQKIVNKVLANVIDYQTLMSNPLWLTEIGNNVNPEKLTNQIGGVIQTSTGKINTVKRDIPPAMQSGIIDLLQWLMRTVESISGVQEASQGRKPQGVTAAAAIETLQEAAQTRIRLKERNLNVSLSQMGQMIVELMLQYYRETRVARITGKENAWPTYFDFFIEDAGNGKIQYNKRPYEFDEETEKYTAGMYEKGQPSAGIFDVKVQSGTSLPFAKQQRTSIAMQLFDKKAIDVEELLEALDWPNKEALMKRMQAQAPAPEEGAPAPGA